VDVDYVSYSSYDAIQGNIHEGLFAALNHIESKLRPKPGIPGKRVFIGEYRFPARRYTPEEQNRKSLEVMLAGIEWGLPVCPLLGAILQRVQRRQTWRLLADRRREPAPTRLGESRSVLHLGAEGVVPAPPEERKFPISEKPLRSIFGIN